MLQLISMKYVGSVFWPHNWEFFLYATLYYIMTDAIIKNHISTKMYTWITLCYQILFICYVIVFIKVYNIKIAVPVRGKNVFFMIYTVTKLQIQYLSTNSPIIDFMLNFSLVCKFCHSFIFTYQNLVLRKKITIFSLRVIDH